MILQFPHATTKDERTINNNLHACGCRSAAIMVAAGLAIDVAFFASGVAPEFVHRGCTVAYAVSMLFALALIGKVVGLLWAEWRLRSTIDEVGARSVQDRRVE